VEIKGATMLQGFALTLYEIFGYMLPGSVCFAALSVCFWTFLSPTSSLSFLEVQTIEWIIIAIISYVFGHILQGLCNFFMKITRSAEDEILMPGYARSLPNDFVCTLRKIVGESLSVKAETIAPRLLYEVCDEAMTQSGKDKDRDVYIYREGFYRGLCLAFVFLAVSCFIRTLVPGTSIILAKSLHTVPISAQIVCIALCVGGSFISYFRFKRFAYLRVKKALIGFLLLNRGNEEKKGHI
jgi:hypothetical protein